MFGIGKKKKRKNTSDNGFSEIEALLGPNVKLYKGVSALMVAGLFLICVGVAIIPGASGFWIAGIVLLGISVIFLASLLFFQVKKNKKNYDNGVTNETIVNQAHASQVYEAEMKRLMTKEEREAYEKQKMGAQVTSSQADTSNDPSKLN